MTGVTSSRCPTPFELGIALRVATILEAGGTARATANASYALMPTGGVYRQEHFTQVELLLERCKLLEVEGRLTLSRSHLKACLPNFASQGKAS